MRGERNSLGQGEREWCGVKGVWFMQGILGDGQTEGRREEEVYL